MDNRFSRVKSPAARAPQKNDQYKRGDIIAGLDPQRDYRGVSHYFTPDGTTIYTFFVKGQHGNNWNRPVFTYGNLPPPPLRFFPKTKKTAAKPATCFTMTMTAGKAEAVPKLKFWNSLIWEQQPMKKKPMEK